MKNALMGLGALVVAVAVPAAALAATYQYVNVDGILKTEDAPTAAQALLVSDIAPHSGVILENDATDMTASTTTTTVSNASGVSTVTTTSNGTVIVTVPAGTHVHTDTENDNNNTTTLNSTSDTTSNNGCVASSNQVINTSGNVEQTSTVTATGSSEHFTHTSTSNC